jgi:uncharacterized protein (TIGR02145 family)
MKNMKTKKTLLKCFLASLILFTFSCKGVVKDQDNNTTEQDNGTFKTVTIGNQVWMAENLNISKFRNGDIIPEVRSAYEWKEAGNSGNPAWCYYENDTDNGTKYGKLYNWYAVVDSRNIAPEGWHIPSYNEWIKLIENFGGRESAGKKLKSTVGWYKEGNGDNESGFAGLPGGYRYASGDFDKIDQNGFWWSTSVFDDNALLNVDNALYHVLKYSEDNAEVVNYSKLGGFSVRCVKD